MKKLAVERKKLAVETKKSGMRENKWTEGEHNLELTFRQTEMKETI